MGILAFYNNIRYLGRFNLKKMYKVLENLEENIEHELDHIKFELVTDQANLKRIKICNNEETLNKLINSNCSMSRFGDGEVNLIFGSDIPCQKYNKELSEKLKEVITSANPDLMLGMPNLYMSYENSKLYIKKGDRRFYGKFAAKILSLLNSEQEYYNAAVTFPYINCGDINSKEYYENCYSKFQKIWNNKNITIVCGERVFDNIKCNIFENAASVNYIYAPTNNAFDEYNDIINKIKQTNKNDIIILILGPTATVMAYDLMNMGYRALDLGHIAKDYNAYKLKIESNDKNIIEFFQVE